MHPFNALVGYIEVDQAFRLVPPTRRSPFKFREEGTIGCFLNAFTAVGGGRRGHPSVGESSAASQLSGGTRGWDGWCVKWDQLPYPGTLVPAREICRIHYLGGPDVYGNRHPFYIGPISSKGRSISTRMRPPKRIPARFASVFRRPTTDSCIRSYLMNGCTTCRVTTGSQSFNAYLSANISDLLQYSGKFLSAEERERRLNQLMDKYYGFLAISALKFREQKFWTYHKTRLPAELGYPFSQVKLAKAIVTTVFGLLLNPKSTFEKLSGSRQIAGLCQVA